MANTFKMRRKVAERLDVERSLSALEGAPRLFGASAFLWSWSDGLRGKGISPISVPSIPARLMIRANRERLAYFLTYCVGVVNLSPHLGEPTVEIPAPSEEKLEICIRAAYRRSENALLLGATELLQLTDARQRLLSRVSEELGVSLILDQTRSEMCVRLGIPVLSDVSKVREESAVERRALLSAIELAFSDLPQEDSN